MYQAATERELEDAREEWADGRRMTGTPLPPGDPPEPPAGPGGPAPRPGRAKRAVAVLAAALTLLAGGYGIRAVTASGASPSAATPGTSAATSASSTSTGQSGDLSSLVQRAERAVVKVTSRVTQVGPFGQTVSGQAVGTGFIVSSDGMILTNDHVVEAATGGITVTLADGKTYGATVTNADSSADLAVLRIDAAGLPTLTLGDSSKVLAGQSVVAIGYALDLEGSPTVTTGIVSSTARTIQVADADGANGPLIRTYRDVFQISAAINSGNSGGPLLDLRGRVIGIDTAGAQGADNIGFAIPIDQAKALIAGA